ncbi:tyrosine-type recombinase/integrase [Streptomyces bobili]|uniref:tyrosine-type recombinase/integrase n=1 Tax=Streptomyces bobili TaxID=67280 RepID=UPI00382CDD7C
MARRQRPPAGSCEYCASWGEVTMRWLCPPCGRLRIWANNGTHGRYPGTCRRCGYPQPVAQDGTCRACLLAVRAGQDEDWMWSEVRRGYLPPGRPRQLTFSLAGVTPPEANPLRKHDQPMARQKIPPWVRELCPPPVRDDPRICPPQMPGQLGLFPAPRRTFTKYDGGRIHDREIPDLPHLIAELRKIADERGVTAASWSRMTWNLARLALAAREPGERQVRPELVQQLPTMQPTVGEALRRAGLLAPKRPRLVPADELDYGSCGHCFAWANDRLTVCLGCRHWSYLHRGTGECRRCHRDLPIAESDGLCRFCRVVTTESEIDFAGIALVGGDQLWLGREAAPQLRTLEARYPGTRRKGRFESKRKLAQAAERAARPVSTQLVDPGQLELFPNPPRDWGRLDEAELPALTAKAEAAMADFATYIEQRGWTVARMSGSTRTLRVLVAHLGADAPIHEKDVRLVASLSSNHQGARVVNYLRRRGLLAAEEPVDGQIAAARKTADGLPKAFGDAVQAWIDVLTGQGSKPSLPRSSETVNRYVRDVAPTLRAWEAAGLGDPREITKKHVEDVVRPLRGAAARNIHVGLRSMFRALKRERLIFRDPARTVSLSVARRLPVPLSSDRLRGLLDRVPGVRDKLIVALTAVHALPMTQIRRLRLEDLDRARGQLRVRRDGRMDHVVFLDELTMNLATAWIIERVERWPDCTNPYLIVSRQTAVDDLHPQVSNEVVRTPFQRARISPDKLRQDRLFDEARETADPVRLMRVFGLCSATATRYVAAAHPDKKIDPIRA